MSIAELVAVVSGGVLLLAGVVCIVAYMVKYAKQYGTIKMLIHIGWIIVGISALALFISLWFVSLKIMVGITIIAFTVLIVGIGAHQSDN